MDGSSSCNGAGQEEQDSASDMCDLGTVSNSNSYMLKVVNIVSSEYNTFSGHSGEGGLKRSKFLQSEEKGN